MKKGDWWAVQRAADLVAHWVAMSVGQTVALKAALTAAPMVDYWVAMWVAWKAAK